MQGSSLALLQDLKSPHFHEVVAIYIYIYMHAVELKTGPIFAFSSVKNWSIFLFFFFFCF